MGKENELSYQTRKQHTNKNHTIIDISMRRTKVEGSFRYDPLYKTSTANRLYKNINI
jgi:hypothetical protein